MSHFSHDRTIVMYYYGALGWLAVIAQANLERLGSDRLCVIIDFEQMAPDVTSPRVGTIS